MTTYQQRFETILPELSGIVEKMAEPFGAVPEEYRDDEFGLSFSVEQGEETLWVTVNIDDGKQANRADAGNIVLRIDVDGDPLLTIAPDNFTSDVFVPFSDDDAWEGKLDSIRVRTSEVIEAISSWKAEKAPRL